MATTNLPNGVTNVEEYKGLGTYLAPDPSRVHQWFDDFDSYTAGNWTVTETQAGATQAIVDADGGVLALVNSAADNDLNQIQWAKETFRLAANKQTWIKARFKISNATESDVLVGLYITDTSPVASKPSDGFYFQKLDGSTSLTFECGVNSTYTSTTVATMANDTYVVVAAYYNGYDRIELYLNDQKVATSVATNLCTDEDLAVSLAVQNGDANARTLSVDYLLVSEER